MAAVVQAVLRFEAGGQPYGLDVADVIEVVPAVPLRVIPGAPSEIAGVFRYRDAMVPVLNVTQLLTAGPALERFSTRIVLVRYLNVRGDAHVLGLLVENASQTITEDLGDFKSSGILSPAAPYLGKIATFRGSTLQLVHVRELIPEALHELLFAEQ